MRQSKKSQKSKFLKCVVNCLSKLTSPFAYICETAWAVGAGVVAAMVSVLTHWKGLRANAAPFFISYHPLKR